MGLIRHGSSDATTSVVAAHNDMLYAQNLDCEIHYAEKVTICVYNNIGDVSLYKN